MDLNDFFKVGEKSISEYIVKREDTADFIGNEGIIMLSTPAMIKFIENATLPIITGKIPENCRPVGTKIEVEHINPTPVGMKVTVKIILTEIEVKKLIYEVEVFNEKCKIGFGTYEQHVINKERFLNKYSS